MNWISVEERLPEENQKVLGYSEEHGIYMVDWMILRDSAIWASSFVGSPNPTHWMPLPEPPFVIKGEEQYSEYSDTEGWK